MSYLLLNLHTEVELLVLVYHSPLTTHHSPLATPMKTAHIPLYRTFRSRENADRTETTWSVTHNRQLVKGAVHIPDDIENITSIKINNVFFLRDMTTILQNYVFYNSFIDTIQVTALIHEFIEDSFASSGRNFHFIGSAARLTAYDSAFLFNELKHLRERASTDTYGGLYSASDAVYLGKKKLTNSKYTFNEPIRKMPDTLTVSFAIPYQKMTWLDDTIPVVSISIVIEFPGTAYERQTDFYLVLTNNPIAYNIPAGSIIYFSDLTTDQPTTDQIALRFFNRPEGFAVYSFFSVNDTLNNLYGVAFYQLPGESNDTYTSKLTLAGTITAGVINIPNYNYCVELELEYQPNTPNTTHIPLSLKARYEQRIDLYLRDCDFGNSDPLKMVWNLQASKDPRTGSTVFLPRGTLTAIRLLMLIAYPTDWRLFSSDKTPYVNLLINELAADSYSLSANGTVRNWHFTTVQTEYDRTVNANWSAENNGLYRFRQPVPFTSSTLSVQCLAYATSRALFIGPAFSITYIKNINRFNNTIDIEFDVTHIPNVSFVGLKLVFFSTIIVDAGLYPGIQGFLRELHRSSGFTILNDVTGVGNFTVTFTFNTILIDTSITFLQTEGSIAYLVADQCIPLVFEYQTF